MASDSRLLTDSVPSSGGWPACDFDPVRQRPVLLYPEGAVLLNDTGAAILELVDGQRTVERDRSHPERALPRGRERRIVTECLLRQLAERELIRAE